MKTPYCTAAAVQRRTVDALRVEIGANIAQESRLQREQDAISHAMSAERDLALHEVGLHAAAWFRRQTDQRDRLEQERREAAERLEQLRDEARDAFGALTAIDGAVDNYRQSVRQRLAAAEQLGADDRTAAEFIRLRGVMRAR